MFVLTCGSGGQELNILLIFPPSCLLSVYIIPLAPLQQVNLSQGDPFVENQWDHIPFIVISSICLEMSTFLESETCCVPGAVLINTIYASFILNPHHSPAGVHNVAHTT